MKYSISLPPVVMAALLVSIFVVACGMSATPSPVPPTAIPTLTPVPTQTPIPGFVAGEENLAYSSFAAFYAENCRGSIYDVAEGSVHYSSYMIDMSYKGWGVYVGDAIWRFHIREFRESRDLLPDGKVEHIQSKQETTVVAKSYPDGTWNASDVCPYQHYFPFTSFEDIEALYNQNLEDYYKELEEQSERREREAEDWLREYELRDYYP